MCTRQTGKLSQGSIVLATRIRFAPLTIPISLEIYVSFIARDSRRVLQRGAITTPRIAFRLSTRPRLENGRVRLLSRLFARLARERTICAPTVCIHGLNAV